MRFPTEIVQRGRVRTPNMACWGGRCHHHPKLGRYLPMMRLPSVVVMQYPAVVRFLVVSRIHRGA